ncbi:agmatine deiminase family protein [Helicobacter sp. MIT 14-3879]|uniref:agmatine deiminase family protein n=1 Tax=Helicobacter sp. MIT 14-3879 TaxID=2040649 RepID=UPI000E1EF595|nr:agmatine deiminase family protein [Helicobacter sp. MIT 14-3879]RDU65423.1 agmatine deiminase [Helicobacter sp. MIT 14-3879]
MSKAKFKAEWEKQQAIILAMPHKNSDWKPYLKQAQNKVIELIKHISRFEKVIVIYEFDNDIKNIQNLANVVFIKLKTNDTWCRDFAPLSLVKNNKLILLDFIFNSWGMKYSANFDNLVSKEIFKANIFKNATFKQKNFILEGGSIDSNGEVILTTSKCLLDYNRNKLSKKKIEKKIKKYLNVSEIFWLDNGEIIGDDTDCHIDNLARFISKDTIVYLKCNDKKDYHYKPLCAMENELKKLPFKIIPIPMPKPIFYKNKRLPASYINFLFINNAILLPIFNDKMDKEVIAIFKGFLKDREIIPVDSRVFLRQGGGIHCLSMQFPSL